MRRTLLSLLLPIALLAGCGSAPTVDTQVRDQLLTRVAELKRAAAIQDRPGAESALAALTREVAAAQAQGRLDEVRAQPILEAADRVTEDIRTFSSAPVDIVVPPPEPLPTSEVTPPGTQDRERRKGGHKHDSGGG
jgi:outer membrane murein-binding lipoprotein Lpp